MLSPPWLASNSENASQWRSELCRITSLFEWQRRHVHVESRGPSSVLDRLQVLCLFARYGTAAGGKKLFQVSKILRLSGLPWVSSSEPVRLRRFHVAAPAWSCHVLLLMALCVGTLGKTLSCIPSCKGMSTSDLAKLAAAQPPSSSQTFDHSVLFSSGWMQPGWRPTLPTPGPATEVEANESARSLVRKTGRRWKTQQTNVNNM